jgi:hypothetical protein
VPRDLVGIEPVKVIPRAGYANRDPDDGTVLVLVARCAPAEPLGTDSSPEQADGRDTGMLVVRMDDADDAARALVAHGAIPVAEPRDRPERGAGLRAAHLRHPYANLVEPRSY